MSTAVKQKFLDLWNAEQAAIASLKTGVQTVIDKLTAAAAGDGLTADEANEILTDFTQSSAGISDIQTLVNPVIAPAQPPADGSQTQS